MKFILTIGANAFYTYEKNGQKVQLQNIEGSDQYPFSLSDLDKDVAAYLDALRNENNLRSNAFLSFDVLEGADNAVNTAVINAIDAQGSRAEKRYALPAALETAMKKLSRDKTLMIHPYGINYEGCSYKLTDSGVERGPFDLLAYTVHGDEIISLTDI